jgi:hypothetical protein
MYYEAMRQPAFDVGNPNYTSQHFVEAKYGDLIIS